jgi:MFS family permease
MLFPFLPFMIGSFGIEEASVGTYAGIVASSMFAGRFFGSYIWGMIADSHGHKLVLITSSLLVGLSTLVFGYSVNMYMAVITRLLVGFFNGLIGTAKAALSASSTDKTQAFGLSVLSTSFTIGLVIGPAISGAIADPINQYNISLINGSSADIYFNLFPYSFTGIANCLVCVIAAVLTFFLLPEIRKKKNTVTLLKNDLTVDEDNDEEAMTKQEEDVIPNGVLVTAINGRVAATQEEEVNEHETCTTINESDNTVTKQEEDTLSNDTLVDEKKETIGPMPTRKSSFVLSIIPGRRSSASMQFIKVPRNKMGDNRTLEIIEEQQSQQTEENLMIQFKNEKWIIRKVTSIKKGIIKGLTNLKAFMKDPVTRFAILVYCIYSFAIIGFDELYSVWCATPINLGGIGFTLREISISLTVAGALSFPFMLFIFPLLEKLIGSIYSFQSTTIFLMFLVVILPNLHFLALLDSTVPLWVILCTIAILNRIVIGIGFSATSLFINNSVTSEKLGSVNGLSVALTSLFRCFAPLFAGGIFSASLSSSIGFPFDYHLVYILLGIIIFIAVILATRLPTSINKQKLNN